MKLWKTGDISKAICPKSGTVEQTVFQYRNMSFDDGTGHVPDLLVAVCSGCGEVHSIPPQSTPAIRRERERAVRPLEVLVPAPVVETLDMAAYRITTLANAAMRKRLFSYFLFRIAAQDTATELLRSHFEVVKQQMSLGDFPKRRVSFRLSPEADQLIIRLAEKTHLKKTQIFLGVVGQIDKEIVQPDAPDLAEIRAATLH